MLPAFVTAMQDRAIRGNAREVYVFLYHRLDVLEHRTVKIEEVSFSLRMSRSSAGAALLTLVRYGYLERRPRASRTELAAYRLFHSNPAREPLATPIGAASTMLDRSTGV